MKLTEKELLQMQDLARKYWVELPGEARLPGMDKQLNPEQRRALSWLYASMVLLRKFGIEPGTGAELEYPDSDTVAEGFERAASNAEESV